MKGQKFANISPAQTKLNTLNSNKTTWHGLVLIVAEFCNACCFEKEELKR